MELHVTCIAIGILFYCTHNYYVCSFNGDAITVCFYIDVGGAGGKGTWGKLVEVYDEGPTRDSKDPNYDSEEEVRIIREELYCFTLHSPQEYVVTPTLPEMSVDEFQQHGEEVIKVTIEISICETSGTRLFFRLLFPLTQASI